MGVSLCGLGINFDPECLHFTIARITGMFYLYALYSLNFFNLIFWLEINSYGLEVYVVKQQQQAAGATAMILIHLLPVCSFF